MQTKQTRLSATQQLLLDLALQNNGVFYPHLSMWHMRTHKHVNIQGAGFASAIRALIRNGKARAVPELHPYAFEIMKEPI